jgi:hypothetical protein
VCLLLAAAAVSGAQPNGTALPGNAHYLLPAAEAWTTPLPAAAAGPAALDTLHVYVPLADGRVVALARQSGAVAWTGAVGAVGAPYPSGERVLVPTRDGIAVLDARTGAPVWIVPVAGAPFGSLVVERGVVAAMADDGRVTALDLATGEVRWSRALGLPAVPALAASAGRLHVAMGPGQPSGRCSPTRPMKRALSRSSTAHMPNPRSCQCPTNIAICRHASSRVIVEPSPM